MPTRRVRMVHPTTSGSILEPTRPLIEIDLRRAIELVSAREKHLVTEDSFGDRKTIVTGQCQENSWFYDLAGALYFEHI